jgi:hypothetical protein
VEGLTDGPIFVHDCSACVFLGHARGHDLYFCEQHRMPTVTARYGSEGVEYRSGLALAGVDPELGEAKARAIARGLLTESA